ncbi:hypothetical protein FRACA_3300004 [Frankia canadensis]|uniref:Uncharacterized protein n=1 Tax=Frankia canadensis TaxID=1836972 RepID=A0A2I2KUU4_9ACTN|nr:hypothetical protein [Frankia canadensis]SNQ49443.1 hypothetical protein FRACA_3300004 [Frankia canadensis]SOU56733.1 hypothetical protein FRACA_3300004 [Frankia canadensis]
MIGRTLGNGAPLTGLAELDLLNEWVTPIGSAVFAIPPGCAAGGFVGETLLG